MAKILVIDDDQRILEFVKRCLTAEGHEVITAESGVEGLKIATKGWKQPHLIILDIRMAGMDGLQVLKKLKENEKTCSVPVVMFTGTDDEEVMKTAMGSYALQYIIKPIGAADLVEKVAKVLAHR